MRRAAVLALLFAACTGGDKPRRHVDAGTPSQRKVKPPPNPDDVRVYWPYAIRSDGVGLYLLDAPLADVLHLLPEGPRVELLEIGDLMSWRIVRADEGRLIIGADERSHVAFITVMSSEVARTDSGLMVGSTGAQLTAALGAERSAGEVVRTRRVYEFDKLPNVEFVTDAEPGVAPERARVIAVIVARPHQSAEPTRDATPAALDAGVPTPAAAAARAACKSGGVLADVPPDELWATAHAGRPRPPSGTPGVIRWGCVSGSEPEAILLGENELALVAGVPGKLRRVWVEKIADAARIQPIDLDGDGKDELLSLDVARDDRSVSVQLSAWGWAGGKLVPRLNARPVVVTREQAAAAGTTPAGIELWAEAWPAGDALMVGGLYAARTLGARVIAPIAPVRVRLEPGPGRASPVVPSAASPVNDAGPPPPPVDGAPPDGQGAKGKSQP